MVRRDNLEGPDGHRPAPLREAVRGPDAQAAGARELSAGAALALLAALSCCRGAPPTLATPPAEAPRVTDELLTTLASRFGPIRRAPDYDALRPRLLRGAFAPSRIHKDAAVWAKSEGPARTLVIAGELDGDGYRMGLRPDAPAPSRAADYRAQIQLLALGSGEYEWRVRDELGVGGMRSQGLSDVLTHVFLAADETSEARARERIARTLPRAADAFGRLFRLERLRLEPALEEGRRSPGTLVTVVVRLAPDGIRATYPRFASYLVKRVIPMRARIEVGDESGARYWDAEARDDRLTLRLRVHEGRLVPLAGEPRPLPERLLVKSAFSMKSGMFRVGLHDLLADVRLTREPHEKAFTAIFKQLPDWDLPFVVQPLLRGPLRRPFQGEGSLLRYAILDGSPTLLVREYRLAVKESWIVRWLGGISGSLVSEFRAGAEAEMDRFSRECLMSLREDVRALLTPAAPPDGYEP